MLRASTGILSRLTANESKTGSSQYALEFVRWRRKPRWLPIAKSKMFRVPEHPKQSPEEKDELLRLHNNYRTQMRSLRQYLREENDRIAETSTAGHFVLTPEQEEAEFQRCLEVNAKWNQEVAAIRDERLAKEREEMKRHVEERLRLAREREEEKMEKIESQVRMEKELSKNYITKEKLDAAIEYALANPVDFNYAIDKQGNIYKGRHNSPKNATGGETLQILNETPDRMAAQN